LRFKNQDGDFKPNMFAQIAIHTTGDESALLIPKEALIRTGNQDRVVLALGKGSFKSVAVSVGRYDSENVEILEGLSDGEEVVSSAQFLLDSESSKSSDFKRMNHDDSYVMNDVDMTQDREGNSGVSSATVIGTVNSLMVDHGMINISRSAIEKWNRPAATVDFIIEKGINLAEFEQGMEVKFTFEIKDGNFVIVEISQLTDTDKATSPSKTEVPVVDHSNH
jgi:Cu(I)/Ag(I) efflux system membrane fusion protein